MLVCILQVNAYWTGLYWKNLFYLLNVFYLELLYNSAFVESWHVKDKSFLGWDRRKWDVYIHWFYHSFDDFRRSCRWCCQWWTLLKAGLNQCKKGEEEWSKTMLNLFLTLFLLSSVLSCLPWKKTLKRGTSFTCSGEGVDWPHCSGCFWVGEVDGCGLKTVLEMNTRVELFFFSLASSVAFWAKKSSTERGGIHQGVSHWCPEDWVASVLHFRQRCRPAPVTQKKKRPCNCERAVDIPETSRLSVLSRMENTPSSWSFRVLFALLTGAYLDFRIARKEDTSGHSLVMCQVSASLLLREEETGW